jgi:hypothetical protein
MLNDVGSQFKHLPPKHLAQEMRMSKEILRITTKTIENTALLYKP